MMDNMEFHSHEFTELRLHQESEIVGFFVFSHIRIMGYFRLGYVRVYECPDGLEPL